jgi:CTP synthase (UTP-ammonia lyase)
MWIAVIGDRVDGSEPQDAIATSLAHAAAARGASVPEVRWLATDRLERDGVGLLDGAAGAWCAPGSPYRSLTGALGAIASARTRLMPLLGTCAGFQHGVIEFARNALGHATAAHAEYGTGGDEELFIDELSCSLVGQVMDVDLVDDQVAAMYGARHAAERYYCRFGLNPTWRKSLNQGGLIVAGTDTADGDVRILRLEGHPFYVLALFVPQTSSTPAVPHPLVTGFLDAVNAYAWEH